MILVRSGNTTFHILSQSKCPASHWGCQKLWPKQRPCNTAKQHRKSGLYWGRNVSKFILATQQIQKVDGKDCWAAPEILNLTGRQRATALYFHNQMNVHWIVMNCLYVCCICSYICYYTKSGKAGTVLEASESWWLVEKKRSLPRPKETPRTAFSDKIILYII